MGSTKDPLLKPSCSKGFQILILVCTSAGRNMYINVDRHGFRPIPAKDRTAVLAAVFVVMCEQTIYGVRRIGGSLSCRVRRPSRTHNNILQTPLHDKVVRANMKSTQTEFCGAEQLRRVEGVMVPRAHKIAGSVKFRRVTPRALRFDSPVVQSLWRSEMGPPHKEQDSYWFTR